MQEGRATWIGTDGQGLYMMTLHLGPESMKQWAKGDSLLSCLPGDESTDWGEISIEEQTVELRLL